MNPKYDINSQYYDPRPVNHEPGLASQATFALFAAKIGGVPLTWRQVFAPIIARVIICIVVPILGGLSVGLFFSFLLLLNWLVGNP